ERLRTSINAINLSQPSSSYHSYYRKSNSSPKKLRVLKVRA
ncbi:5508_t:CDS:1, partial [Funneliformis geosporum]